MYVCPNEGIRMQSNSFPWLNYNRAIELFKSKKHAGKQINGIFLQLTLMHVAPFRKKTKTPGILSISNFENLYGTIFMLQFHAHVLLTSELFLCSYPCSKLLVITRENTKK